MAAQSQLLDTNVLLRFLTGEPPAMARKARTLMERADQGEVLLLLLPVIVAEAVYTLESFYELERSEVAEKLIAFLCARGVQAAEPDRVLQALQWCRDRHAHFADAYLAAAALELGLPVASFDRDVDKLKQVTRLEPGQ